MDNLWKEKQSRLPVEIQGKREYPAVDKKHSISKAFLRVSTKIFSTTTVTKKRLVYVLFKRNMPAKF